MSIESFDGALARLQETQRSESEDALLDRMWRQGEDGWLREDRRFRQTPWGRWIPATHYLVNDLLVGALREGVRELVLADALREWAAQLRCPAAVCGADPRIRLDGDRVRLAASELTREPLLEEVEPLLRFVTHLPVLSLQAAAASLPNGDWGARAEPQHVEARGWLQVENLGRPLNRRMFVARIKGQSMDGGTRPIPDRAWAVFEFSFHEGTAYDSGADRPVVLVRGEVDDPETGTYAVKQWDRRAAALRLVSFNPDKDRFPDIVLEGAELGELRIVATLARVLGPEDFARRPRPERTPGRRVVEGDAGLFEQGTHLERRIEGFFEGKTTDTDHPEEGGEGLAELVCLEAEGQGLCLRAGPLPELPPFVKRVRVVGADGEGPAVLATNVRQRPVLVGVQAGGGPWRWEAVRFEGEDDLGLGRLATEGLPRDEATVFRVDSQGVGLQQRGRSLSPGQRYRLVIPPREDPATPGVSIGDGWRLWELELAGPSVSEHAAALESLGLGIGEAWPRLEWGLMPPMRWGLTARAAAYPVFARGDSVTLRVTGLPPDVEVPRLFVQGPAGTECLPLTPHQDALVALDDLETGRWACALVHPRTGVRSSTLLFEVADETAPMVSARWSVTSQDGGRGPLDLGGVRIEAPAGWPVSVSWRTVGSDWLGTVHADAEGRVSLGRLRAGIEDRVRRAQIGDLVFDLGELGQHVLHHDGRSGVAEVREGLERLWARGAPAVRGAVGNWTALLSMWFEPICALLGYRVDPGPRPADTSGGPPTWRLLVDERRGEQIHRTTVRVLVMTTDVDALLEGGLETVDRACLDAEVRDAIVTDGMRWTTHRRGSRLKRPVHDLGEALGRPDFSEILAELAEGL